MSDTGDFADWKEFRIPETVPEDVRSTMRKRARKVLFNLRRPYVCQDCLKSPAELPKDAPPDLAVSPLEEKVSGLQANHINKNLMDIDPKNLEWLCPSCHKIKDSQTEKGVSVIGDEFGYDPADYGIE